MSSRSSNEYLKYNPERRTQERRAENQPQENVELNWSNVAKFIYAFGIPAAIAVYLIWFMVSIVDTRLKNIDSNINAHQIDTAYILKTDAESKVQLYIMSQTLQRICVNTATNQQARNNCFGISEPGK